MSNIIDSIQLSGTVYTLSAQTGGGGVPESAFTAYTAATDERISQDEEVTAAALNVLNESLSGKQDTLSAGTNIKTINNESILGSGNIDIQGGGTVDQTIISGSTNAVAGGAVYNKIDEVEQVTAAGLNALNDKITPTVELTQAEYDALTTKDPNTYYIITDAQAGDLTQYWTSAQTQSAINQATSGKANQSDFTGHTANTNVHLTTTEKTNLDSLATNISAISGITASKKSNWDTAYSRSVDNAVSYIQNTSDYSSFINKIWAGTQSQYDQLAYKDNYTLYIIKDNN